jgi:anaerobic selenocysteine-containing dehydrogenase
MNADDIKAAGLQQGELVDLTSYYKQETRVARHFMVAPLDIARHCTATYFPEANVLVSINNSAERSNTPVSKSLVISIVPSKDPSAGVDRILREAAQS